MGLFNRIFSSETKHDGRWARPPAPVADAYGLERYRYMLQTAPPETVEQAHAEAFETLTPEQRRQVLDELAHAAPPDERAVLEKATTADPRALARLATRAEIREPGIMERTLGTGRHAGFGANLLGSFAASFAGSMVASSFFSALGNGDALSTESLVEDGAFGIGAVDVDLDDSDELDGVDYDV